MTAPDTARYETLDPLDVDLARVDRLLGQSRIATLISAILVISMVVVAALVVNGLWPPRANQPDVTAK